MKTKTTIVRALGAAMIAAAVVPWAGSVATAAPTNEDCPAGTTFVAKFQNSNGTYTLEDGTAGVVTLSGTSDAGGSFTSTVPISAVFVKGGTDDKTDLYDPPVTSGTFNNTGLLNEGGQVPAISHVTFCTGPTSTPSTTPPTTPSTTPPTTTPATTTTTAAASVLPTKAQNTTEAEETEVAVEGTKAGSDTDVLAATGSGLSLGLALAISFGLLLGGAALLFVPRRLALDKGQHRRH